jgi:hypothetical protein
MSKMYSGKEVCQGCGKPGTKVSRYSKDELCQSCKDTLKLGLAKDVELKEEYTSVSSWPTALPSLDFGDRTLSDLLRGLLDGLHNPSAEATSHLHHPFNPHNIHGSQHHTIPARVVEPMKEFFTKIQDLIREIKQEKEGLPKMAKDAIQEEKDRIYNEGVEKGRDLLFQLNQGSITQDDFAKKLTYKKQDGKTDN